MKKLHSDSPLNLRKLLQISVVLTLGMNLVYGQDWPPNPNDYIYFGAPTLNQTQQENYALLQGKYNGFTLLNSPTQLFFRIGNTNQITINNEGATFHTGFLNLSPAHPGYTYFGSTEIDQSHGGNYALLQHNTEGWTFLNSPERIYFRINNTDHMHLSNEGNFGIGTITPKHPLHIKDSGYGSHLTIETDENGQGDLHWYQGGTETYNQRAALQIDEGNGDFEGWVYNNSQWVQWLHVNRLDAQVGIGTTAMGNHKLAVEGSIGAREIKVEASSWSDFVFDSDYELRSLAEVEEYVNENGHLPEIPNEEDVKVNGVNLGEMNAKLLQKIEELTLYLIEQNKELKAQNEELKMQRREIETLRSEVSDLKEQ